MWKPGTSPPSSSGVRVQKQQSSEKFKSDDTSSPLQMAPTTTTSSSSVASTKKLSGATMNMRFMKRKDKADQQEQKRKQQTTTDTNGTSNTASSSDPPIPSFAKPTLETMPQTSTQSTGRIPPRSSQHDEDDMDVDHHPDSSSGMSYQVATPIDMYGMQAALIGRRSFGGFNPAIEEAWKESKASIEHQPSNKRGTKVSDEELLQRYETIVKKRSESKRPVGNLREKSISKRQRRLK